MYSEKNFFYTLFRSANGTSITLEYSTVDNSIAV